MLYKEKFVNKLYKLSIKPLTSTFLLRLLPLLDGELFYYKSFCFSFSVHFNSIINHIPMGDMER